METAYLIQSEVTGETIEAHDIISLEWATQKVETHNKLFKFDHWIIVEVQL